MSKTIKVGEIRGIDKANDKVEVLEFEGLEIEVKQYIPMAEKRLFAETIVHAAFVVDNETGLNRFDRGLADTTWGVLLIKNYTNINSIQDPFQMYDIVKSNGILDAVEEAISEEEVNTLITMIRTRINEAFRMEKAILSTGYKLEGLTGALFDKVDAIIGVLTKEADESLDVIQDFKIEDLETLSEFIKVDDKETKA